MRPLIAATLALLMGGLAFFAASTGPFKSVAAARNNTEEVLEIEIAKCVPQSSHSRKLRPRQAPIKLALRAAVDQPFVIPEFVEARLSFWLRPPNLLRAPPALH